MGGNETMTDLKKDKLEEIVKKFSETGYGYYLDRKKLDDVLKGPSLNCSDRVPSDVEYDKENGIVRVKMKNKR